ncbi:hypothetical protein OZX68_05620 [Streptococcaceae bacterium ESL0729]|nr:hypothetical protein OZX68_05620 [Streptococcaceae bacterium ESL0729]
MKINKLMGLMVASSILLGFGANVATADTTANTNTLVTVIDATGPDPLDPSDSPPGNPNQPGQLYLQLQTVPDTYGFQTSLNRNGLYTINATTYIDSGDSDPTPAIKVFNDRSKRKWNVKAQLHANTLTTVDNKIMTNVSFSMTTDSSRSGNPTSKTMGTGTEVIVAQNSTLKGLPTPAGSDITDNIAVNTGVIATPVTAASVSFTDGGKLLKVDDVMTGQIDYQLYIVAAY